jgi:hypothetical protein
MLMLTRADATARKKLLSLSQIRQQLETTFSQLWLQVHRPRSGSAKM